MMNWVLVFFDSAGALALLVLMAQVGCDEKYAPTRALAVVFLIRRTAYACTSIALFYRVWDLIETDRPVSFIGGMLNMILVASILLVGFTRPWLRKEPPPHS